MDDQIAAASKNLTHNEATAKALDAQRTVLVSLEAKKKALADKRAAAKLEWEKERAGGAHVSDECKHAAIGRNGC